MKKNFILVVLSLSFSNLIFCQKDIVAAGGQAIGGGGSVSYSIGQIDYITSNGSGGMVTQGVQQPYEIFVISGIEEKGIDLFIKAYPNPTLAFITLDLGTLDIKNISYVLYDVQGKKIKEENISSKSTMVEMSELSSATYFLEVKTNNLTTKQFKIVKN